MDTLLSLPSTVVGKASFSKKNRIPDIIPAKSFQKEKGKPEKEKPGCHGSAIRDKLNVRQALAPINSKKDEKVSPSELFLGKKEKELVRHQQAMAKEKLAQVERKTAETKKELKSKNNKKREKKKNKTEKPKNPDALQKYDKEKSHRYEDLPLFRQVRLRESSDEGLPLGARYYPTPPGHDKMPIYPKSRQERMADYSSGMY